MAPKVRRSQQFLVASLVLLLTVESGLAAQCRQHGCFNPNTDAKYQPAAGQQFTYDFESAATVQLLNKDNVETTVTIKGQAQVFSSDNCGYTLVVKSTQVIGPDKIKAIVKDFAQPIQFTIANDELANEICAESNENGFALNVKRGIISAFQNSVGKSTETDIFGKCPVTIQTGSSSGFTTINKRRNLNHCAYREKFNNGIINSIADDHSEIKSAPLLNGEVLSEVKLQNNVLQSAVLTEAYTFLPFSTNEHGARAKVITKLTLKNTAAGAAPALKTPTARSVLFENANTNMANNKIIGPIKNAYTKTLTEYQNSTENISESASIFAELIRLLRLARRSDILGAYQQMKSDKLSEAQKSTPEGKAISRRVFLDALFRVGSGDSVDALAQLVKKKELNEKEQKLMFLSLNLVQSVNKEAINSLAKLFDDNLPKEAYLSIGNVINKYCRDRSCEAGDIKLISDKFLSKIPKNCKSSNRAEEEMLLAVLKGLRNSQNILNPALDRVIQCTNDKNSARVRVVALQAFTANPCNNKLQAAALSILKNRNEDSEVRIEAYLAAMECPSGALANEVQALLENEPIYQVGSYINTHLNSIRASTDPKRSATREHFRNIRMSKKFPVDPRRYSFNNEFSYAIDSMGLGSSYDTNVIYSQTSFLPRSARFNMTGELFGNAFNMLEVNGRQENLDNVIEHYFGPNGILRKMNKQQIFNAIAEGVKGLSARQKRGVREDAIAFDKNVKFNNDWDRELDLDLSVKIFGSELFFLSLGQNLPSTPKELLEFFMQQFENGLDSAKKFNFVFENHALFLDAEVMYPTALGLPLKLTSTGSGVMKLETDGEIDLRQMINDPKNAQFRFKFAPSASIYVAGLMSFDAYAVTTGLQVSGTFFTATGLDTKFELQNGKGVKFFVQPTRKNQNLIDMKHEISTVTQENGKETIKTPFTFKSAYTRDMAPCFDQVEMLTGFTFCTEVSITQPNAKENAHFPLYGNNHFAVRLEMVDSITFTASYDDSDPMSPSISISHDTPNEGKSRPITIKLDSSLRPEHFMAGLKLSAPIDPVSPYTVDTAVGFKNDQRELKIYFFFRQPGTELIYELGVNKNGNEFTPILKLNQDTAYVDGKIVAQTSGDTTTYRIQKVRFTRGPETFTADGKFAIGGAKIDGDVTLSSGQKSYNVAGGASFTGGNFLVDVTAKSPNYEMANGKLKYNVILGEDNFKHDLLVIYGSDLNSKTNRIEVYEILEMERDENKKINGLKFESKVGVGKYPFNSQVSGEFRKNINKFDLMLDYQNQKMNVNVNSKCNQKTRGDYDLSMAAGINQKSIKFDTTRVIEGEKSKITNKVELSTGVRAELNGLVGNTFNCHDADVNLMAIFVPGAKKEANKVTLFVKNTQKEAASNGKITSGKNEVASFDSKVVYGDQMSGTLKASVKDLFNGEGSFNSNKGKGEGNFLAGFKNNERKLKIDSQFNVAKPTYDITTDFYYDFEKDNTKKVHFETKNQIGEAPVKSLDSKNKLEIFGEKYGLNVFGQSEGTFKNGKQKGSYDILLPTGRRLSGELDRQINIDGEARPVGTMTAKASDELPNKTQRQVVLHGTLNELNRKTGIFDGAYDVKFKDFDNKDLKLVFNVKNLKKGHYSAAGLTASVDGSLIAQPVQINVQLDEYCSNHAIYNIEGKYGKSYTAEMAGKYYLANLERPLSHEFTGKVSTPYGRMEHLVIKSNGQLTEPKDDNGSYLVQYKGSVELTNKNEVLRGAIDTQVTAGKSKGSGAFTLELPNQKPIRTELNYNYNYNEKATTAKMDGALNVQYGENKKLETNGNMVLKGETDVQMQLNFKSELEQAKDISMKFEAQRPNDKSITTKGELRANGQSYAMNFNAVGSETEPKLYLEFTKPSGTTKISADAQVLGQHKGKGQISIENLENFNLKADMDGDISSIDNFYIRGNVDSPSIKEKSYGFDIKSKAGDAGKTGFDFELTSGEGKKHVVSGSADFSTKLDKGRTIVEGKSTVKITDGKPDEVNFKLIKNVFESSRDGETGFSTIINVFVGAKTMAAELKVTDKDFHMKYTDCQASKQCTNLEARSQLEKSDLTNFKHMLMVTVDLRQVGFTHEFGLKADTSRDGLKISHLVDMYLQAQDKPQYQYNIYIQPTEAGAVLTLPTRTVSLEGVYKFPDQNIFGRYDVTVTMYLDKKNKPQQKTTFGFTGDAGKNKQNVITGRGEMKFEHPTMKPLRVGGKFSANPDKQFVESSMEVDIFRNPNDMIVVTGRYANSDPSGNGFNITSDAEIVSRGLGLNFAFAGFAGFSMDRRQLSIGSTVTLPTDEFKFGLLTFANQQGFEVIVIGFNEELIHSNANYDSAKNDGSMTTTFKFLGSEPTVMTSTVQGLTSGTFQMKRGQLFNIESGVGIGKEVFVKVIGSGRELFNGRIALDQSHFLATNYKVNEAEIKAFTQTLQETAKSDVKRAESNIKNKYTKVQDNFTKKLEAISAAAPDFKPLEQEYQNEFKKLVQELKSDETMKKYIETIVNVTAQLLENFNNLSRVFGDNLHKLDEMVREFYGAFIKTFNENILPDLQKLYESVQSFAFSIYENSVKLLTATFERVAKALKTFEEDFNKIAKSFSEITSQVYEAISSYITAFTQEMKDLFEMLSQQIQSFPGVDMVKEKYQEMFGGYNLKEQLSNIFKELTSSIKFVSPTDEGQVFIEKVTDYIGKKLSSEQVDDITVLKDLYASFLKAIQSFRSKYAESFAAEAVSSPFTIESLKRLPPLFTSVRMSTLNRFRNDMPMSLRDAIYLYRPYAFDVTEMIPPFTLHAEIADGSHIFTFDGRHLTFPGGCSYILARDFVEGNFSIVATMAGGKLKSLTLADKKGSLEINNAGMVSTNGKPTELPYHSQTLNAWRDYYTVSLLTTFGAELQCTTDLRVCHFRVSGYYLGKTRGLLGNGNNEPYDDYLLPSNKITEDTAEFGNSYRTQASCAAVAIPADAHKHSHSNEFCSKFFASDSPLRFCFLLVNPTGYREACEHAAHTAGGNPELDACNIAQTYASRCRHENIPVTLPKQCAKCNVGGQALEVGDDVAVKTPQTQADIVVVVDTKIDTQMGELVQPVINELRRELKARDITDVNVAVIGYSKSDQYIYQFTTKGQLNFLGDLSKVAINGPKEEDPLVTGKPTLDNVLKTMAQQNARAKEDLGVSADARAFQQALKYPFRATATKTIIAIRSDSLVHSSNPAKQLGGIISSKIAQHRGIAMHVITPVALEASDKSKNIVGFNNKVALLINEKKRANMGSVDARSNMKYKSDLGIDLVEKSNGYVFILENFATDKKKYTGIVSYVLADAISRTEIESECKCVLRGGLYPETECEAKESRLLAPKTVKNQKG